jgi:hypothetical protein
MAHQIRQKAIEQIRIQVYLYHTTV